MARTPSRLLPAAPALQAYLLGSVPFEVALALQRRLVYQVAGDRDQAVLLLCEHAPLISVGRQGSWAHVQDDPDRLAARGWPIRWVNRGGGCQLHLPGQFAIYSILALDRLGLDLPDYLRQLSRVFVDVLADFNVRGETRPGEAGVWVAGRPVAQVGVAVRDWVSYYGAVFNVNPDLLPFRRIRAASGELPMTSLERERRGPLRPAMVRERLVEHFAARFGFSRIALFFDHPSLSRKAPSDALAASS
jgi:lipoyl(octanoyl) transferase